MNKEIATILTVGAAILIAVWMTWTDVTFQLTSVSARLGRVEGALIEQGRMERDLAPSDELQGTLESKPQEHAADITANTTP